jgi:hypothetical protein
MDRKGVDKIRLALEPALMLSLALACLLAAASTRAAGDVQTILERDWERQLELRFGPVRLGKDRSPAADAAGGVDGVIDGNFGFHTAQQNNPWWQVDLAAPATLDRIVIYNRCDIVASRAARIQILLSLDGLKWEKIYTHNGKTFYGKKDGKPLVVGAAGRKARYVRLSLAGRTFLHLDEIQVFDASGANVAL